MQKFLSASIFVLALCFCAFAQANKDENCPTVYVLGPSGIVQPDEIINYSASVDTKGKKLSLEFFWSVTNVKILEGQGTSKIKVEFPVNGNLTATVQVKGFPEGCPNTNSETLFWDPAPEAVKIDEFSGSISQIEKFLIEEIISAIKRDPTTQLYVIVGHKGKNLPKTQTKKEKEISNLLVKENGISADRITMIRVFSPDELTQFWIVPVGATPPNWNNRKKPNLY